MVSNRQHRDRGYRIFHIIVLLCPLMFCTAAWSAGKGRPAEDPRPRSPVTGPSVVVHDGRLSVDLREADLGEVLAQIGRQAGIRVSAGPNAGKRVSARFADVELEAGLRRLLGLASLSHLFLYTQGPAGSVAIAEVRVLGEGTDTTPRQATVSDRGFSAESEVPEPVPAVMESPPEPTPEPGQAEPSEVTRRIREVFSLGKAMGRKPQDGQESSPNEPKQQSDEQGGVGEFAR
jgi:hypothetical protein